MKKALSLILCLLLFMAQIPAFAIEHVPDGVNFEFIQAVRELVNANWDDSFFASITLKPDDSKMLVDGEEMDITTPVQDDNGLMLPVVDIAKAIGADVNINKADGQITIIDDDKSQKVYDETDFARRRQSRGQVTVGENGHIEEWLPDGSKVVRRPLVDEEKLEELLEVESIRSGESIIITKPFQLKQVVLKTKSGAVLTDTYGATAVVTDNSGLYLLQYSTVKAAKNACEALNTNVNIEYASPNSIVTVSSLGWGTDRITVGRFKEKLVSDNKVGQEVTVAVVDSGVDASHPFLQGRLRTDLGYNFVDNNSDPSDGHGHGTHVSGTVVDCSSSNVKVIPVKVLNSSGAGDLLTMSSGIRYAADSGADVINMSFGVYHDNPVDALVLTQAVDYAASKGSVCVAAAGNDAIDAKKAYPANMANVITVAATDDSDKTAVFSNYGDVIDIAAPGVSIKSCVPGGRYDTWGGTSMAAPHVTAAAAMILTEDGTLTPDDVKAVLQNTAVDCGTIGRDRLFGVGIVDFRIALGDIVPPIINALSTQIIHIPYPRSHKIAANILPDNATNKGIIYSSSDENIAVYEGDSIVAKGLGTATISLVPHSGVLAIGQITVVEESAYWVDCAAEAYADGNGTENDPYLIEKPEQLAKVTYDVIQEDHVTAVERHHYKLIADIDLAKNGLLFKNLLILETERRLSLLWGTLTGITMSLKICPRKTRTC